MSVLDGMARLLAEGDCGAYSPDSVLPAGQVPIALGGMPAGDGDAIAVATYAGGPEPDARNGWEYPRLQVKVRSADPLAAMDLERTTFEVLQGIGKLELSGPDPWWLQDCYALQSEAEPLGRDANGRWEYVRNYQLTCWPV